MQDISGPRYVSVTCIRAAFNLNFVTFSDGPFISDTGGREPPTHSDCLSTVQPADHHPKDEFDTEMLPNDSMDDVVPAKGSEMLPLSVRSDEDYHGTSDLQSMDVDPAYTVEDPVELLGVGSPTHISSDDIERENEPVKNPVTSTGLCMVTERSVDVDDDIIDISESDGVFESPKKPKYVPRVCQGGFAS